MILLLFALLQDTQSPPQKYIPPVSIHCVPTWKKLPTVHPAKDGKCAKDEQAMVDADGKAKNCVTQGSQPECVMKQPPKTAAKPK